MNDVPVSENGSDHTITSEVVQVVVLGEPASKANSRKVVLIRGSTRVIKSDKARAYGDAFLTQCRPLKTLLEGDLSISIKIYYASRRPDLDESLILDLLQGVVYTNDRQVKEKHIYWGLDKDCPRAEIEVKKMPPDSGGKPSHKEKRQRNCT
jgi:Holliday junction resolvase RusA-like endonuclease